MLHGRGCKLVAGILEQLEAQVEQQMAALMGFGGFDSTKGKPVEDNKTTAAKGHVAKHKRREYRQYMSKLHS